MKVHLPCHLKPKTDLVGTSDKNSLRDGLVKPLYEFAKLVTETSSKVQELKAYNIAINNLIHSNKWHETIDKEL